MSLKITDFVYHYFKFLSLLLMLVLFSFLYVLEVTSCSV